MKKLSKEILWRDARRDMGAEVLDAIREVRAGGGRRFTVHVFNSETLDLLREIAKSHCCARTRHMALQSLALASPDAQEQVRVLAMDLPQHLQAELVA